MFTLLMYNAATSDLQAIEPSKPCCQRAAFHLLCKLGYRPSDANAINFERAELARERINSL